MVHSSRAKRAIEIKICGITNRQDAVLAIECAAHGLGFNLYLLSRRFIAIEKERHCTLARRFVEMHPQFRVTIAGGLTPENVGEAIAVVRPAGVDVTSGVEASYGRKDRGRLQAFVAAVIAA